MTPKEAVKILEVAKAEVEWNYPLDYAIAIDTAIEALEKQMPKKPDYEADGYDNKGELIYDTWICPNCENRYEVDYDHYDYCPKCGQAIDWSEKE